MLKEPEIKSRLTSFVAEAIWCTETKSVTQRKVKSLLFFNKRNNLLDDKLIEAMEIIDSLNTQLISQRNISKTLQIRMREISEGSGWSELKEDIGEHMDKFASQLIRVLMSRKTRDESV